MPTVFDILCTPEGNSVIIPVTASDYVIAVSVSNHHNREKTLLHTAIEHSDISNNSSYLSCCSQLSHVLISKADFDNEWKASVSAWWVLEYWGHMKCVCWLELRLSKHWSVSLVERLVVGFNDRVVLWLFSCPRSDIGYYLRFLDSFLPGTFFISPLGTFIRKRGLKLAAAHLTLPKC